MLEWAGTSYAMANGHPTAIAAADHTAPRNDEDGVAQVLEELFLSMNEFRGPTRWSGPLALVPEDGARDRVDGVDGAGRTTFADALAEQLRAQPRVAGCRRRFHHPWRTGDRGPTPEAVWRRHFDYPGAAGSC